MAIGTDIEPVPVTGFAANFSPMPRMAPPPFGMVIVGAAIWKDFSVEPLLLVSFLLVSGTSALNPVQCAGNEECLNGKDGSRGIYLSRHGKFSASHQSKENINGCISAQAGRVGLSKDNELLENKSEDQKKAMLAYVTVELY